MFDRPDFQEPTTRRTRTNRLAAIFVSTLFMALTSLTWPNAAAGIVTNHVDASITGGPIVTPDQCVTVSFTLYRTDADAARACNVRFRLENLELCSPDNKTLGDWAGAYGNASLAKLTDYGFGEYSTGPALAGSPCGPDGDGILFSIDVKAATGVTDDIGTITVVSTELYDCNAVPLVVEPGSGADVIIDMTPDPVTDFTAIQIKQDNNPPPQPDHSWHVNFQPESSQVPTDYIADTGATFNTTRGYGWFSTVYPVQRAGNPDDPSYTFVKKFNDASPARWEIVVPNGAYNVRVGVGDAFTQGTHVVVVEGQTFFDALLTQGGTFESHTAEVTVLDGRLTVDIGGAHAGAPVLSETKIDLIEIDSVPSKAGAGDPGIDVVTETTGIELSYTDPPIGAVEIYRAKFGDYPVYGSGSVPSMPTYPPDAGIWTLVDASSNPYVDRVDERDFWYYAAFVVFNGNASGGVMSNGTLNYHLGDTEDANAATECTGDDLVEYFDVSYMGFHYGTSIGDALYVDCLDFAPTTNPSSPIDGRPEPDGHIDFQDLVYLYVNFFEVSKTGLSPAPEAIDELSIEQPDRVRTGDRLTVALHARGTGRVQGMSIELGWDPSVVRPVDQAAGPLLETQHGIALAPRPGTVDVALQGRRSVGLSGAGDLATVSFEVLRDGDPAVTLKRVRALDVDLHPIAVQMRSDDAIRTAPRTTELLQNVPNPFNPSTSFTFSLSRQGPVELAIYAVDGRLVRKLVQDTRDAGRYQVTWDGTDSRGMRAVSGVYLARLTTPDASRTVTITLVK